MRRAIKTIPFTRKRKQKTDYKRRLNLIKSNQTRIAIRSTNKFINVQFIDYAENGDISKFTVSSRSLEKQGWKHNPKNLPSAYLVGLMAGKKAIENKITAGIIDFGLFNPKSGEKLYAVLKGLVDSGLKIPHSEQVYPDEKRIEGSHIEEFKKNGITKDFEAIKNKILS